MCVIMCALASIVGQREISSPSSIVLSPEETALKLEYINFPSVLANAFKETEIYIKKLSAKNIELDSVVLLIVQNLELFLAVLETPPVNAKG